MLKFPGIAILSLWLCIPLTVFGAAPLLLDPDASPGLDAGEVDARDVERARVLVLQGRLDEARSMLESVIARAPAHAGAHRQLGQVALREGRVDDGLASLARSVELAPLPEVRFELAAAYEDAGRTDDAVEVYRDLLAVDENDPEAWYRLGQALRVLDRADDAIAAFEHVVAMAPVAPARARVAGEALNTLYSTRVDAWIADLERGEVEIGPSLRFGDTLANMRRFEDARRLFAAIVEQAPDNAIARYWLGRVLVTLRQLDEGIEQLEQSVALAPENLRLRMELARSYEAAGRLDDARRIYTEVVDATDEPGLERDARDRHELIEARLAVEAGEFAAAYAIYAPRLAASPDDLRLRELIAPVLEELERYDEADRNFTWLLERLPDNTGLRMRVAATYERRGDFERAHALYAEVANSEERGSDLERLALERLGLNQAAALLQDGRAAEALEIFERINGRVPDALVAQLGAAMALHRLERYDEAEARYRVVIDAAPDSEIAWLELGQLYVDLDRVDDAIAAYERVADLARTDTQRQGAFAALNPLYLRKLDRLNEDLARDRADIAEVADFGATLVRRGVHQDAAQLLRAALDTAPDDPRVNIWLGRAEIGLGETARGVALIERGARLAPVDPELSTELAQVFEGIGALDEAERAWEAVIRRTGNDEALRANAELSLGLLQARRLHAGGNIAGALVAFERLSARFPDDRGLILGRARLLLELDRDEEAGEIFAALLAGAPDDTARYLQIAQVYRDEGRAEDAERMYREALAIDPENVPVRLAYGAFERDRGEYVASFDLFEQARDLAQGTAFEQQTRESLQGLWNGLIDQGRRLAAAGSFDEAEAMFQMLIERQPDNTQARYWLSEVYRAQGDSERQADALIEVVALDDTNIVMKRRLGLAQHQAGRYEAAAQTLGDVIDAIPFDSEIRATLATAYTELGDDARARAEYLRLYELNPTPEWRAVALDRLGLERARELREQGRLDAALDAAQRLLDDVPDDALVHLALARIHDAAGRTGVAEAAYLVALRLAPGDADARLGLARIYAVTDREADAVEAYAALTGVEPPPPQAATARAELDALRLRQARARIDATTETESTAAVAALLADGVESFDLESFDAAGVLFEQAIRVAPDHAEAHYRLGLVYAEGERYTDAVVFLKRATDLAPDEAAYHHALGRAYREMQVERLAEQALERAVELAPDDTGPRFDLAGLHQARGDEAAAQAQYARILERATERESIARALNAFGLPEDPDQLQRAGLDVALRVFEQTLTTAPRVPQLHLYLGIVYHRLLRFEEAEAVYRRVLAADAGQVQAALRLAGLLGETGRIDDAILLYDRFIAGVPDQRLVALALQQQTALYARKAEMLAEALAAGEGDIAEARRLGRLLVERNAHDAAVPMLEAATRRSPRDPQLWYFLGRAHADRGRFGPGIAALERSAELFPGSLLLRHHLAQAYERAGDIDKAIPLYTRLSTQDDDAQIRDQSRRSIGLIRAARFIEAGDAAGALAEYDDLLALTPDDPPLIAQRGRMLLELDRDDEAAAAFDRILELAPDNASVHLMIAEAYREHDDSARFLGHLAAVIRLEPRSQESRRARALLGFDDAMAQIEAGQIGAAEEGLERILTVVPQDPLTRFELGRIDFSERRFAEAETRFTEAIRELPDYQDAWLWLGRLYETLERPDSAIRAYEQVFTLGRNTPAARQAQPLLAALYIARVQGLLSEGRDEEAIQGLLRLLASDPTNVAARTTLAQLYVRTGRVEDAARELEVAVRIQPDNPRTHAQLGAAYSSLGRDMKAAESYSFAVSLETEPELVDIQVREIVLSVARMMIEEDRPFAAIRHLRAINDHGLGNERTFFMLAAIYRQQGNFDESTRAFRDAVRFAPNNISMRFNLAELYERSNDLDLALIQYRTIVRTGQPGDRTVEEARRRATSLSDRLARFSSQLSYNMTMGESNIEEQDLNNTGALNTRFSSQMFYNLGTNFRPTSYMNLRLDTGLIYISNHSTERDTLVARFGGSGSLNFPRHFYNASVHASDIHELISDTFQGRSYSANISAGLRFTDVQDLLQGLGWRSGRGDERGEPVIEQAVEVRIASEARIDNPRLRRALEAATRRELQTGDPAVGEGLRRHQVTEGEGLREIAAALGIDARRWEEEWRDNPRIVDPGLILPGDVVVLIDVDGDPAILIEGSGDAAQADARFGVFDPEQRLAREAQIRAAVEEGMDHYRSGVVLLGRDRFDAAGARFAQVLARVPDDPLSLMNIGIAHHRLGRFNEAEQALQAALAIDPGLQGARLALAELYLDTRDHATAAAMVDVYAANHDAGAPADEAVALALRIADELEADLLMALPVVPQEITDQMMRVVFGLSALGDAAATREVLTMLLDLHPEHPEANDHLARLLLETGEPRLAVEHAEQAVAQASAQAAYRLTLARALRAAGDLAAAEDAYQDALDITGDDEAARATIRLEAGMTRAARSAADGDTVRALEEYEALLDAYPEDAALLVRTADAARVVGRIDDAVTLLERAIAREPARFDLRLRLADMYLADERDAAANEALTAALAAASTLEQRREVLDRLGFMDAIDQINRGRWRRALATLERIRIVAPDEPLVALNIGVVRQRQGRDLDAETAFQQLLDADPRNLTARLRLGLLYSETGRIDRAITALEQVASESGGQAVGERARAALERLEDRRLRRLTGDVIERSSPTMKTLQARFAYNDTDLPGPSLTETFSYSSGLTLFLRSLRYGDWILNYDFRTVENENPLGTDYAYVSNDFSVTWRTSVPNPRGWFGTSENIPGVTGTVTLNRAMRVYTFADTNALNALNRVARREHNSDTLTLGLNYQPPNHSRISFFANYTIGRSTSNLPVGIIFSPDGIPIAFQSSGLGDFNPNYLTTGMAFQF